jgi:hypothetical protein
MRQLCFVHPGDLKKRNRNILLQILSLFSMKKSSSLCGKSKKRAEWQWGFHHILVEFLVRVQNFTSFSSFGRFKNVVS